MTVRVTGMCSNRCRFCAQAGLDLSSVEPFEALMELRPTADEVSFVGGEPTLVDQLPSLVERAWALGFRRIGLQTNGAGLDAARLGDLSDAGLTDLHLSVHGPMAELHDLLVGVEGAFDRLARVAILARSRRLEVVATTAVTRSGFRHLSSMPELLRRWGVDGWAMSLLHGAGRAEERFGALVPRLGLALPRVVHALETARRSGLPAWVLGAPWCGLGPFAARALAETPRAYASPCEECPARPGCPGVDPRYLSEYGHGELRPRRPPPPVEELHPHLARMFVGVGPLAPATPSSPASGPARLPVLK